MTFAGVRDQEIEWLGKGTSSSSYLFLHLPQWQTLPRVTWDGANHLHGHPIPVASFTELPNPLATSKILSTKNEFSGLQANWDGAVCMRMFNKLSYPPKKTTLQTPCWEEAMAAAHPGAVPRRVWQLARDKAMPGMAPTISQDGWSCAPMWPHVWVLFISVVWTQPHSNVPVVGNHEMKHCHLKCLPGRALWGGHNCREGVGEHRGSGECWWGACRTIWPPNQAIQQAPLA